MGDGDYRLGEALDGMFDDQHGELASLLLDQIAFLDQRITALSVRAAELTAAMPPPDRRQARELVRLVRAPGSLN